MYIYISFGADRMEEELDSASQADTPEQIRRINAAIEAGNRIWESWALESGGEVLELRGFEGRLRMPADSLDGLADMRRRYGQALDAGVSVGVGMKPWEADLALEAAVLSGGDRLRLYGPDVQVFLEEQEERQESQDFLGKADPPLNSSAAGGGMKGPEGPQVAAGPMPPAAEASEHSENEGLRSLIDNQPPQAEGTAAASDLHEQLGSLAGQQQQRDQQEAQAGARADEEGEGLKDLKNQVLGALQVFQAKKDELQAVAQQDPELHGALLAAVQGMIAMARVVFDGKQEQRPQDVQKAEHGLQLLIDAVKQKQALKQKRIAELVDTSSGSSWKTKTGFVVVGLDPHNRNQWRATPISASGEPSSHIVAADHATALSTAADMGADLLAEPHRVMKKHEDLNFLELVKADLMPGGKGDGKPDSDFDAEQLKVGTATEMEEHGLDEARAREVAKDHLTEDPRYYDMEKAALKPGKTGRHDLMLPVGSQKDPGASGTREAGKVKIRHADGKASWVSVRAGQVLSADGHPVSSRNPSGK